MNAQNLAGKFNQKPMTPENYEKLRLKIIAACPELMELKLGCEIFFNELLKAEGPAIFNPEGKDSEYPHTAKVVKYKRSYHPTKIGDNHWLLLDDGWNGQLYDDEFIKRVKILGHPIRISHVLRALNYFVKRDYYVGITGGFYQSGCCEETEYLYTDWNLEQDDLALQSDEVKEFLFDLLCNDDA